MLTGGLYERTSGAAGQLLASGYQRRTPERTVLHELVSRHAQTLLAELRDADGRGLPSRGGAPRSRWRSRGSARRRPRPRRARSRRRRGPVHRRVPVHPHLNRATIGVDNSPGTFEYYTSQIGHGMWLWGALLHAAAVVAFLRARKGIRERFLVTLWAISGVAFFSLVQTKLHHYILPAVLALGLLVAFFLDDLTAGRERLHPLYALIGIGIGISIVLLICRDLMHEPERWIEIFVFRYDRPWPAVEPWSIDPSDGFLDLGIASAVAIAVAATRLRRRGIACLGAAGHSCHSWSPTATAMVSPM